MFTYGYIREATMAHLDIDETEAESMQLLKRFHIYANEAMHAICASKPMYQYIDVTVVKEYDPLVLDNSGSFFRPATEAEKEIHDSWEGDPTENPVQYATEEQTIAYYHEKGIYKVLEKLSMGENFIAFAVKAAFKEVEKKPSLEQQFEHLAFGGKEITTIERVEIRPDDDFSYISKNQVKFYRPGHYLIPAKFLWFRFDSGIGDREELDIPSDIVLTIPLYIASICYQIDNPQKAQLMRQEFETALARCTSTDFMPLRKVRASW